jgi:photosystem II stability/assembly factor-like uncharacterized protein
MKKSFILIISLLLLNIIVVAQWNPSKGLYSEYIGCLKVSGDTIFAGANPGIYISTDYGNNWELIGSSPNPNDLFFSILIDGNYIYAGSTELLMISSDRGQTWTTHPDYKVVTSLIMAGDTLVMSANRKVYFSTDQGNSFVYGGFQESYSGISDLAYLNGVFYAGSNSGLYRTYDRGISWSRFNNIPTLILNGDEGPVYFPDILTLKTENGALYAGGIQRLFVTHDNGETWDMIADLYFGRSSDFIINDDEIYFTNGSETFYSPNHGLNWTMITQFGFECFENLGNYIFGGRGDLFRSESQDEYSFERIGEGMKTLTIIEIFQKDGKLYCLAKGETPYISPTYYFIISSSTDGIYWRQESKIAHDFSGGFYHSESDTIYYDYSSPHAGRVVKTTLNGTFFKIYDSPANVSCFAFSGDTVFCGSSQGVHFSADYCQSWTRCNDGIWSYDITDLLMVNDTLYASTRDQGVFRSTNRGASWSEARQGIINMNVNKLKFLQGKIYAFTDTGLCFSANGGVSWNNLNSGIESIKVNDLVIHGDALLIATDDGLYISHNDGASWMQWNSGIEGTETLCLYATEDKILCGTKDHSVLYRPLNSLGLAEVPLSESMISAFPNPAEDMLTLINHNYPVLSSYNIELHNTLGQTILQTTINSREFILGLQNLRQKGIYFLHLSNPALNFNETKKIIIR